MLPKAYVTVDRLQDGQLAIWKREGDLFPWHSYNEEGSGIIYHHPSPHLKVPLFEIAASCPSRVVGARAVTRCIYQVILDLLEASDHLEPSRDRVVRLLLRTDLCYLPFPPPQQQWETGSSFCNLGIACSVISSAALTTELEKDDQANQIRAVLPKVIDESTRLAIKMLAPVQQLRVVD